jgi:hypothetical protein
MNRDFKGIWIPREIWLAKGLSCHEKCLWAEIHSLFDRERGGCYCSNEYLMEFFGIKERRLQEMLSNLRHRGWIVQVSFDGRNRVIKAVVPPEDFHPEEPCAGQRCGKVHPRGAEKCTPEMQESAPPSLYIEQSIDTRLEHPILPPIENPAQAVGGSLVSRQGVSCSSGSSPKSKKVTQDFSEQVRDVADRMLKLVMKHETTYRPPVDMSKFLKCVKKMIEDEKQDINVLMKAFEWAVTDNVERGTFKGWQSVICTNTVRGKPTNPAEIFHKNLSKINAQSKSRAPRKFDPSSDDQEALEKMKEMSSRAI